MKRYLLLLTCLAFTAVATAQVDQDDWLVDDEWIEQSDYDQFKRQSEKRFNDFRDSINIAFARALDGKWNPFEVEKPQQRPRQPEPKEPPVAPPPMPGSQPVPQDTARPLPVGPVVPAPEPQPEPKRQLPLPPPAKTTQELLMSYCGTKLMLELPLQTTLDQCRLASSDESAVSRFWEQLSNADFQSSINQLLLRQQQLRLNDWGIYDLTLSLSKQLFPNNSNEQVVATVFLLNQMEYDALVCRYDKGLACLLNIGTTVYDIPYLIKDDTRYYILLPDDSQPDLEGQVYTYSVHFPSATLSFGMQLDKSPLFPTVGSQSYNRIVRGHNVKITADKNLIDFYSHYPQVEMNLYANAAVSPLLASQLENAFRPLVQGKGERDAVAALLNYVQYGFDYATDDEQFGYEKPFFLMENFYYPKNDCEDRAILLSWLVRYLLDMDVVLLHYTNHLSMAVHFSTSVPGTHVMVGGKRYVECDPTYIGADIGQTQPSYRDIEAEVIALGKLK